MCGIVAVWNLTGRPVDEARLVAMRDTMVHRGPDGAGTFLCGAVGLGHRRLSIIDLSPAGKQPMCNEDGSVWLIFNGEIYNYVELTKGLRERGHVFRSHTDSEVLLHLWEELGERCVDQLDGMFAFVLWDTRRQELFAARDRAGIKPLHFHHTPDRFIAASEIKAILADPDVPRQADYQGLSDLFLAGIPTGEKTCFQGIRKLQPGWALSLRDGRLRTWQYWDLVFNYDRGRSLDDTVAGLEALLDDVVRIHCRSDAPLGCHLSGGLDSSTVAALTARYRQPVDTFSIRFDGGPYFDESRYARLVAEHLKTVHHEATPGPRTLEGLLATLAWHSDGPMSTISTFSYYTAARLAANHVKVALTGHGGDEVFAGYPAQFIAAFGDASMFDVSRQPVERTSFATRVRLGVRRHGLLGAAGRFIGRASRHPPESLESLWLRLHGGAPLEDPLLTPAFRQALAGYDSRIDYLAPLRQAQTDETLDRCLYHDLRSYLPGLLHQEDRSSMAVSLESRVPLLDHRIVEFLATVPPEQKVVGREPKALLRRAASRLLPAAVLARRDKGAFSVPVGQWLSGELAPLLRQVIFSRAALDRGIFDPVELRSGWHGSAGAWTALSTELWFRIHIDRDQEWLDRIQTSPATPLAGRPDSYPSATAPLSA